MVSTIQAVNYAATPAQASERLEHATVPMSDQGAADFASAPRLSPPQGPGRITYYDMSAAADVPAIGLGPDGSVWFLRGRAGFVGWIEPTGAESYFEPGVSGESAGGTLNSIIAGADGAM